MTELLLVSAGLIHPSLLARLALRRALQHSGFTFQRERSMEALPELPLHRFRGMVLYYHHKTISPPALAALDSFVQEGGGVLALHAAAASFKQNDAYYTLLGGRFVGHGPVTSFQVAQTAAEDAVFGRVPPFTVTDELYRHDYDAGNRVHFYTPVDGAREPLVWTRPHGAGRVAYLALGHRAAVWRHPTVMQILHQGLRWVCRAQS